MIKRTVFIVVSLALLAPPAFTAGDDKTAAPDSGPFFPIGWYVTFPGDIAEIKAEGYNAVHTYVTERFRPGPSAWPVGKAALLKLLKDAERNDLKVIMFPYPGPCHNEDNIPKRDIKPVHLSEKEEREIRQFVGEWKNYKALLGWYIDDEPYNHARHPLYLREVYEVIKDVDPDHPSVLVDIGWKGYYAYASSCDILSPDPYLTFHKGKYNYSYDLDSRITKWMRAVDEGGMEKKPVWPILLAGRQDNWEIKRSGYRGPSFKEMRAQVWLSVVNGAEGIWFYNRKCALEPDMIIGLRDAIVPELKSLSEAILIGDEKSVEITQKGDSVRALLKETQSRLYLVAVNTENFSTTATFSVPHSGELYVVSENRTVTVKAGSFSDQFDSYAVHIYTTDKQLSKLKTLVEIEEDIARLKRSLQKTGNIASEYAGAVASASSFAWSRAPYVLIDGFTSGKSRWIDQTPNEFPDWVEIDFANKATVSTVIVYHETLEKYELQYWTGSDWQSITSAATEDGRSETLRFQPVTTDKIRLLITQAQGAFSEIYEIEVY